MGKKAVHFGAGNIGRGFVAEFLHRSDYEVVFVDVQDAVIDQLNNSKSYKVIQVGQEGLAESDISNYRAINSKTHEQDAINEIITADVVTCSVGPNVLKFIAPVIAKGIDARPNKETPIAVIACENAIGATDTLANYIKDDHTPDHRLEDHHERARFANSAVDRIVPAQDEDAGLDVKLESYSEWVVDVTPFKDHQPPDIKGIKWVDDLFPYIERKLYTVNTGHTAAAYYGYHLKKATVHDALQEKKVVDLVRSALAETSSLIIGKHDIHAKEQKDYVEKIIKRISNPYLQDAVERVGREPIRKLGPKERFVGPASELAEAGKDYSSLLFCVELTLRFQNHPDDEQSVELGKIMKEKKAEEVVDEICQIASDHPLYPKLVEVVKKVQSEQS